MKQFLSAADVEQAEVLLNLAREIKTDPRARRWIGRGKTLGLIFMNPSLRTRMSTQLAARNLGMEVIVLNVNEDGWKLEFEDGAVMNAGAAEHVREAAAVMGAYCDIIGLRAFAGLKDRSQDYAEQMLNAFRQYCGRPLISLESAVRHPLQSLADMLTIAEHAAVARPKVVMTWAPHPRALPQAVPNSFAEWARLFKHDLVITHPKGFELAPEFTEGARIEHNQDVALEGADFVYVKNWSSWSDYGAVGGGLDSWQVTADKLRNSNKAKVMHCLPVRRNVVIGDDVLDGPQSIVIEQAGNRVFAAQAVLQSILGEGR